MVVDYKWNTNNHQGFSGNIKSSKRQSAIIVVRQIKDNIYNPILRELGFLIQNNMYMYSVWFIVVFIKMINDAWVLLEQHHCLKSQDFS